VFRAPLGKQRFKHFSLRRGFDQQRTEQVFQAVAVQLRLQGEQLP
jgi:hypothetical protein